jgi:hypothetical protein
MLQRLQCRDLFDLHVLFDDAGVDPVEAAHLFVPKARHRGLDPNSFDLRYRQRIEQYEKRWMQELREHVPVEPLPFAAVKRNVNRHLRRAGLI